MNETDKRQLAFQKYATMLLWPYWVRIQHITKNTAGTEHLNEFRFPSSINLSSDCDKEPSLSEQLYSSSITMLLQCVWWLKKKMMKKKIGTEHLSEFRLSCLLSVKRQIWTREHLRWGEERAKPDQLVLIKIAFWKEILYLHFQVKTKKIE